MAVSLIFVWWGGFAKRPPRRAARNLFTACAATASVGLTAAGVVAIYGSTNRLLICYCFLTGVTFIAGVVAHIIDKEEIKA